MDDIKTSPFRLTKDTRALLLSWVLERTLDEPILNDLPKLGLMVSYCNAPVAVAFLRVVEGGKGMIDGFIADPSCDHKVRTLCLDQLILDLIKLAMYNDMSGLFGLTTNKRVVERARRLGFRLMPHKLVSMKCSTWNNIGVQ